MTLLIWSFFKLSPETKENKTINTVISRQKKSNIDVLFGLKFMAMADQENLDISKYKQYNCFHNRQNILTCCSDL